jgi:putative phosphoribosyl transferase
MIPGRKSESGQTGREIAIEVGKVTLEGDLDVPANGAGIVLFAHGSGSSRRSPRNRFVAGILQSRGIATLLFDLLTLEEEAVDERTMQLRFNIPLLAKRLVGATRWVKRDPLLKGLRVGYFGASTGAAAALLAAVKLPGVAAAIVSRGGRPDLADEVLGAVRVPTLLIVGGNDELVAELNRRALTKLGCRDKKMVLVPGATHLFEEPGALEEVAQLAAGWFDDHFSAKGHADVQKVTQGKS